MPRSSRSPEGAGWRVERGFTLLEVLGAVLVLAVLYSVLAELAIQGLRAEGESRRRLEASLYADELLSEIEASLSDGALPELGVSVEEDDPYTIELTVTAVDPGTLLPPDALGEDETLASLMGAEADEAPIREIALKISWWEGDDEHSVTRTTLGLSAAEFAPVPESEGPGDLDEGGASGGGGADRTRSKTGVQRMRERWERSGKLDDFRDRREKAHEWRQEHML